MNDAAAGANDMPAPQPSRADLLARVETTECWDLAVIGGGASGLGVALDAAARGFSVVLLEAADFAKGTSSRATKIAHGGVRYLAQGNLHLVREALRERGHLLENAPHLVEPLQFVLPLRGSRGQFLDRWFYGAGLVAYDLLAGHARLGRTRFHGRERALRMAPGLRTEGLVGAVSYWDGVFDDARLALALARTAIAQGACVLNYCRVDEISHVDGRVDGLRATDVETGRKLAVRARCVVNAGGVWVDELRALDQPDVAGIVVPSQGVHLVVDRSFQPSARAILVPSTSDGRVLFTVPWMGHTIIGTTDTEREQPLLEPQPLEEEIDFLLTEIGRHLERAPCRTDIRSMWAGLRPLVRPSDKAATATRRVSREHTVLVAGSGLVTVTGGKWTTYRAMAEDVLAACFRSNLLPQRPGRTANLHLLAAPPAAAGPDRPGAGSVTTLPDSHLYGTEALALAQMPGTQDLLTRGLSVAMVRFAARYEYARTVEDVLARRSRLLFFDARKAAELADRVAAILAEELDESFDADASARAFRALAQHYLPAAS